MKEALEKHLPPSLSHRNARGQLLAEAPFDSGSKVISIWWCIDG